MWVSQLFLYNFESNPNGSFQGGGVSEEFIGNESLASEFDIVTKARMGLIPGGASKEGILQSWKESEEALKAKKVLYLIILSG